MKLKQNDKKNEKRKETKDMNAVGGWFFFPLHKQCHAVFAKKPLLILNYIKITTSEELMKLGTHDLFKSGTHDLINKLGMFLAPKLAIAREISRVSPILLVLTGCVTYEFSEEENASALSMSVKGGLSAEEVEPVIEAYYDQMQSCKDKVPPKDAKGVVTVEFDIGHRGKVVATEIKNSTVASEELEKCVRAQLRKWQFPEPREDGQATVTYPFQFD